MGAADDEVAAERAVLGDELQQRGDPQGELISLQVALEQLPADAPALRRKMIERRIAAVLDDHHDALYGVLAPHVNRLSRPDLFDPALAVTRWRGGFAEDIWLQATHKAINLADAYRALITLPIARFVRRLALGLGDHPGVLAALASDSPPTLRNLVIGDRTRLLPQLAQLRLTDTGACGGIAKQLAELRVEYGISFVPFDSPTLRTLSIYQPYQQLPSLLTGRLPALEELSVQNFVLDLELFDRYPKIQRADISSPNVERGWLEHFLLSPQAERVRSLTLRSFKQLDYLDVLFRHVDRAAMLERLEFLSSGLSAGEIAAASARLPPNVRIRT